MDESKALMRRIQGKDSKRVSRILEELGRPQSILERRRDVGHVSSPIGISRLVELHRMVKFEDVLAVKWSIRSCRRSRTMAVSGWRPCEWMRSMMDAGIREVI